MLARIDGDEPDARLWLEQLRSPVHRAGLSELFFGVADPDQRSGWRRETGYADFRPRWKAPVANFGDVATRLAVSRWLDWVAWRYESPEAPDIDRSLSYWLAMVGRRCFVVVASAERVLGGCPVTKITVTS
jgi:hypothetical protein